MLGDVELYDIENGSTRKVTVTERALRTYRRLFDEFQHSVEHVLQQLRPRLYAGDDGDPIRRSDPEDDARRGGRRMSLAFPLALAWAALAVPDRDLLHPEDSPAAGAGFDHDLLAADLRREAAPVAVADAAASALATVQILLLLLLVFALTEPFFTWEILQARRLILVVDNSASMRATDVTPTRLDAAKELGKQAITGLRFRDEMAIIAAGTQPQVVCGLTGHERTLQTALAGIAPSDGPTKVPEAIALGKRLSGRRQARPRHRAVGRLLC